MAKLLPILLPGEINGSTDRVRNPGCKITLKSRCGFVGYVRVGLGLWDTVALALVLQLLQAPVFHDGSELLFLMLTGVEWIIDTRPEFVSTVVTTAAIDRCPP